MTRRDLLLLSPAALSAAPAQRPNIVIFLADDLTRTDIEPYAGARSPVRTPRLAALAKQGVTFDRIFTATAMCAPLRQQLLTGLFPVRNGAYPNHSRVYDGIPGAPVFFKELGYRVGRVGKKHFGPDESFPFELLGADNVEPDPADPSTFEAMEKFLRRDARQPFFLWIASHQPHQPWNKGTPAAFPPARLRVPPHLVDHPATRAALGRYYAEVAWLDQQVGAVLDLLDRTGQRDNTLFVFLTEHGSQLPFSKWTCYETGLHAGAIVRWPGRVKPATRAAAMVQYVDLLPTLLEAAGGTPPKELDGRSFLGVLEGRQTQHARYVFGVQTTKGIINGSDFPIRSVRDERYKYIRNLLPDREFTCVLTRDGIIDEWEKSPQGAARAAAFRRRPAEELYDLSTDPYELKNLAGEAALLPVQQRLSRELDAFMQRQNDQGAATEARALERRLKGPE